VWSGKLPNENGSENARDCGDWEESLKNQRSGKKPGKGASGEQNSRKNKRKRDLNLMSSRLEPP